MPSSPTDFSWTSHDLQRFFNFIDYLKDRFAIVIIDLPPVLGLAETIRLAMAADSIALVIRWGRTERQFVQLALDALRTAITQVISAEGPALVPNGQRNPDRNIVQGLDVSGKSASGKRATDGEIEAGKFVVVPGDQFSLILDMEPTDIVLQES